MLSFRKMGSLEAFWGHFWAFGDVFIRKSKNRALFPC